MSTGLREFDGLRGQAVNPFLPQDVYVADGEVHVFGGRAYLFGSHDVEGGNEFCMGDYEFFSAPVDDLLAWTSRGVSYNPRQDPLWSPRRRYAYAPDVVRGNDGRFYLYYCLAGYQGPISVAVCDEPDGNYDYLGFVRNEDGSPLRRFVPFDPAVMNDGGTICLYYGTWWPFDQMPVVLRPIFRRVEADMFGKTPQQIAAQPGGVMGPVTCTLQDDMLTVATQPVRVLPTDTRHTPFASHFAIPALSAGHGMVGHGFFEASSIRKVGERYVFVYSSVNNHELCYATSDRPDGGFTYGGVLVSNGDVGVNGRDECDRANATGTTHGSIECIGDQWYVFYHRLTHGTDWSRQMCAEKIFPQADGSIEQVPLTSCGLSEGDLRGRGSYPATICCHLTNGHMPHTGNRAVQGIPMVTHEGEGSDAVRFVGGMSGGCYALYRYFDLTRTRGVGVVGRGSGSLEVRMDGTMVGRLQLDTSEWQGTRVDVHGLSVHASIELACHDGRLDLLTLELA